jgi:hypothetical protein
MQQIQTEFPQTPGSFRQNLFARQIIRDLCVPYFVIKGHAVAQLGRDIVL